MGTPYLCSSEDHKYGGRKLCKHLVHKFDQLFTANEQIFPLNTFSNTFTIQRPYIHAIKFFLGYVTAFSVAMLMSRGVNLGI